MPHAGGFAQPRTLQLPNHDDDDDDDDDDQFMFAIAFEISQIGQQFMGKQHLEHNCCHNIK